MSDEQLFQTQRSWVIAQYQKENRPFRMSTVPYHSTQAVIFDIVDVDTTYGLAFGVARAGQTLDFFNYGVGDTITLGRNQNMKVTDAETNLAKGKSTNGATDFVIEGMGISSRALLVDYTAGSGVIVPAYPVDPDVVKAFAGENRVWDPASILVPPQAQSPANLENGLFQSLITLMSLEFESDRKTTTKMGVADLMPQGGGASYLRANGAPESDNRFELPEGYLWRRDGEPDSEFIARVTLERPLVVPISLRADVDDPTSFRAPNHIVLEIVMRVFGVEFGLPTKN